MKDWKKSSAPYEYKPAEIDTTSSPTTVYERRNFVEVTRKDTEGNDQKYWEYEERTYTKDEYSMVTAVTEKVALKHESDIIDVYTAELVEGGLI